MLSGKHQIRSGGHGGLGDGLGAAVGARMPQPRPCRVPYGRDDGGVLWRS
jgi:hypothetical protein